MFMYNNLVLIPSGKITWGFGSYQFIGMARVGKYRLSPTFVFPEGEPIEAESYCFSRTILVFFSLKPFMIFTKMGKEGADQAHSSDCIVKRLLTSS